VFSPQFARHLCRQVVLSAAIATGAAVVAPASHVWAAPTSQHVVRTGDTLWSISQRYGVTVAALTKANRLTERSVIVPGQKLSIPAGAAKLKPAAVKANLGAAFPDELRNDASLALIPLFKAAANESGVSTDLLMGLVFTESTWRPWVRSRDGAIGLGQLLPATVEWVGPNLLGAKLDATRPSDNLRMAAAYLRWLQKRFSGNNSLALAAYFEGAGTIEKRGPTAAGRRYAAAVLKNRAKFVTAAR
jgi:soluble lytic murein transglycosylase-like protein